MQNTINKNFGLSKLLLKRKKTQISAEFLIIVAAVFIIGVALLTVFSSREQQIDSVKAGIYASAQA